MKPQPADSLISLDLLGLLLADLNKELTYKAGDNYPVSDGATFLTLWSDGNIHRILLIGTVIWDSDLEKKYEKIPVEAEIELNERENFEKHLRQLIKDHLQLYKNLEL